MTDAVAAVDELAPDVVLLDLGLPDGDAFVVTHDDRTYTTPGFDR